MWGKSDEWSGYWWIEGKSKESGRYVFQLYGAKSKADGGKRQFSKKDWRTIHIEIKENLIAVTVPLIHQEKSPHQRWEYSIIPHKRFKSSPSRQ